MRNLTLIEVLISTAILTVLVLGIFSFQVVTFTTYTDQQISASVQNRGRIAIDQIVTDLRKALSVNVLNGSAESSEFQTLYDNDSGVTLPDAIGDTNSRGIFFREVLGATSTGPVFGPHIVIVGPHSGSLGSPDVLPSSGLVRLRQTGLDVVAPNATFGVFGSQGSDGVFGTFDDITGLTHLGEPELQLLIPSVYGPSFGDMFRVDQSLDAFDNQRILTLTLRLNWRRGANTDFPLSQDVVIQEQVALRQ